MIKKFENFSLNELTIPTDSERMKNYQNDGGKYYGSFDLCNAYGPGLEEWLEKKEFNGYYEYDPMRNFFEIQCHDIEDAKLVHDYILSDNVDGCRFDKEEHFDINDPNDAANITPIKYY